MSDYCIHDLTPETCDYCKAKVRAVPFALPTFRPPWREVIASFDSDCALCGRMIHEGEAIAQVDVDGWAHEDCAKAEGHFG